ncbi:claret isoform a [Anaeramoeba ignava]|uniref:Claret isoform a n=1 Tax=Anaeramoeba ignava TaxID=1746090 RepID=A0A9Q0LWL4_ANAIG|nr:claret isoform a [Anaeramoeba ignava]
MMKNVSKIFLENSSNHVFLLNSNQELFGCGFNSYGQLGLGESNAESEINKLTKIQNVPKGKIIDIKENFIHAEIRNLMDLAKDEKTYEFTEIKSSLFEDDDNILEFSVGSYHTLILTSNSKLIGFGNNSNGQLGTGDTKDQLIPIQIELFEFLLDYDLSNYHVSCGAFNSFLYYSPSSLSNLEEDLIKLFRRKEFCNISFKTENGEIISAHKLILKYRLKDENQIEELQEIISKNQLKNQIKYLK